MLVEFSIWNFQYSITSVMTSSDCALLRRVLMALLLSMASHLPTPAVANTLPEIQQLMKQGRYPQALEKADAYLARAPRDAQGRFFKGLILTEMNRASEAIAVFSQLTEDYPDLPEPYNNLAVLYAQQKQYDRARQALEMAIRTHPAYAVAYENLGDVYAKLASQAYDKALQLDSANAAAQNKLALIHDLVSAPPQAVAQSAAQTAVAPKPPAAATVSAIPATAPKQPSATVVAATPGVAAVATKPPAVAPSVAAPSPSSSAPAPVARPGDPAQDISRMIAAWSAAWARQDVKAYLAFYAPEFKPAKGLSRKDWEAERKERVSRPAWIRISYDAPRITIDGKKATARFRQHYNAPNFKGDSDKTLVLERSGNGWLILGEDAR
jgi:tetratricopeptide (TPR) repeat protein